MRLELRLLAARRSRAEPQPPRDVFLSPPPAPPPLRLHAPEAPRLSARLGDLGYEMIDDAGACRPGRGGDVDGWLAAAMRRTGGHVLWLAERPDSYQTHLGHLGRGRARGAIVAGRLGQQHELAAAGSPVHGDSHAAARWTSPSPI